MPNFDLNISRYFILYYLSAAVFASVVVIVVSRHVLVWSSSPS